VTPLWWRVTIGTADVSLDALAAVVIGATGQGVEEPRAGVLCTALESPEAAAALVAALRRTFPTIECTIDEIPAVDWNTRWRDGIVVRRFGRLVVGPSWLPPALEPGEVSVVVDPQSAFGSGEHGSTRGALALLERCLRPGARVADFGSGSGILAIAAVKLGARAAIGIEVDDESVTIARGNAIANGVEASTEFLVGDVAALAALIAPADLICSNILRSVNTLLLPTVLATLAPTGVVLFAGMEVPEAPLFRPVLASSGLAIAEEVIDAGWWSVAAGRA
jgi:ribosomal protein L11 methyltransferase